MGDVWNMIRSMRGIRREWQYPVLKMGEEAAGSDEEKAEMIANAPTQIHSSDNLTEEGKRGREVTRSAYPGVLERREENNSTMNAPFTMEEMKRAIMRSGLTSLGKDEICYVMLKHLCFSIY